MILRIQILWIVCVLAACDRTPSDSASNDDMSVDAFYVWQRDWRPAVRSAVAAETGDLFPLVGEAHVSDGRFKSVAVDVDWQAFATARSTTPVYRLHVGCMAHSKTVPWLKRRISALPKSVTAVQLDVDCPERRLAEYASLITRLRSQIGHTIEVSVTALPCHLNNRAFRKLAKAVDWYVVQVHGIEPPRTLTDDCRLMRMSVAQAAIDEAEDLGVPYKVALPTYAYRLFFDSATGRFKRIAGENTVADTAGWTERVISAELTDVAALVRQLKRATSQCRGIIWFRLPVLGDRLCISRSAVADLMNGRAPSVQVVAERRVSDDGVLEVYLVNEANVSGNPVELHLDWARPDGEFSLSNAFAAQGSTLPGLLPPVVIGLAPTPGERRLVGWFRTPSDNLSLSFCKELSK